MYSTGINPAFQAEMAFRADRARREISASRRRRFPAPFWGEAAEPVAKRAE